MTQEQAAAFLTSINQFSVYVPPILFQTLGQSPVLSTLVQIAQGKTTCTLETV